VIVPRGKMPRGIITTATVANTSMNDPPNKNGIEAP